MYDIAVKNGLCFINGKFIECSVGINGNRISYVGKEDIRGDIEIDASKMFIFPGFFNTHTHAAMTLLRGYAEGLPLRDWLEKVWEIEGRMRERDVYWGSVLACVEMLKSGITAFADMYIYMDGVVQAVGESGMRAVIGYGMADRGDEKRGEEELKIGVELIKKYDGSFGGRVRCMLTPHAPYTCSPEFLEKVAEIGRDLNVIKHIHLSETLWEVKEIKKKYGMRPAELLHSIGFLDDKTLVAHAVWLTDSEMELLATTGTSVAHCPSSNMKLSSGIARVYEMLKMGINVSLASDGAASNNMLNLLQEIRLAALLQNLRKRVLPPSTWLKVATENGYRAYNLFGGVLKKGALADIVTIDRSLRHHPVHDPASSILFASTGCEVSNVIVDGELVVEDSSVLSMDESKVLKKVEKVAERLVNPQ
ncbi:amidohydrolase [Archaeoglobus neptunius]|uniref:amidohydrolase n=1 Tax=Archaeoglobus neptunius TaxID=2798580 RepID=UPI0019271BA6|nr:amidohydrolase [Archaeoglobus neptunius]